MSDLAKRNLHGPVHTLRSEFAEWDLTKEEWQPPRHFTVTSFLPDGSLNVIEGQNPDGSTFYSTYVYDANARLTEIHFSSTNALSGTTSYHYDQLGRLNRVSHIDENAHEHVSEVWTYEADGRKTKSYSIPQLPANTNFFCSIEGSEESYSAVGATTIVTRHDAAGHPDEVLFHDSEQRVVQRILFERDSAGRTVKKEVHRIAGMPPELPPEIPLDLFHVLTTYTYYPDGRVQERNTRMGPAGESRTSFRYDDHGNVVHQTNEEVQREMGMDEAGQFHLLKENSHRGESKMEYVYDAHGNWTEMIVSGRAEPNPNFYPSNIECRQITYY
jgi:hypothetical protein